MADIPLFPAPNNWAQYPGVTQAPANLLSSNFVQGAEVAKDIPSTARAVVSGLEEGQQNLQSFQQGQATTAGLQAEAYLKQAEVQMMPIKYAIAGAQAQGSLAKANADLLTAQNQNVLFTQQLDNRKLVQSAIDPLFNPPQITQPDGTQGPDTSDATKRQSILGAIDALYKNSPRVMSAIVSRSTDAKGKPSFDPDISVLGNIETAKTEARNYAHQHPDDAEAAAAAQKAQSLYDDAWRAANNIIHSQGKQTGIPYVGGQPPVALGAPGAAGSTGATSPMSSTSPVSPGSGQSNIVPASLGQSPGQAPSQVPDDGGMGERFLAYLGMGKPAETPAVETALRQNTGQTFEQQVSTETQRRLLGAQQSGKWLPENEARDQASKFVSERMATLTPAATVEHMSEMANGLKDFSTNMTIAQTELNSWIDKHGGDQTKALFGPDNTWSNIFNSVQARFGDEAASELMGIQKRISNLAQVGALKVIKSEDVGKRAASSTELQALVQASGFGPENTLRVNQDAIEVLRGVEKQSRAMATMYTIAQNSGLTNAQAEQALADYAERFPRNDARIGDNGSFIVHPLADAGAASNPYIFMNDRFHLTDAREPNGRTRNIDPHSMSDILSAVLPQQVLSGQAQTTSGGGASAASSEPVQVTEASAKSLYRPAPAGEVSESLPKGASSALVSRVLHFESGGNPNATARDEQGRTAGEGPMQLVGSTGRQMWKDLGFTDAGIPYNPKDPVRGVMAGTQYLNNLLQTPGIDGSTRLALASYYYGPTGILKAVAATPSKDKDNWNIVQQYLPDGDSSAPKGSSERTLYDRKQTVAKYVSNIMGDHELHQEEPQLQMASAQQPAGGNGAIQQEVKNFLQPLAANTAEAQQEPDSRKAAPALAATGAASPSNAPSGSEPSLGSQVGGAAEKLAGEMLTPIFGPLAPAAVSAVTAPFKRSMEGNVANLVSTANAGMFGTEDYANALALSTASKMPGWPGEEIPFDEALTRYRDWSGELRKKYPEAWSSGQLTGGVLSAPIIGGIAELLGSGVGMAFNAGKTALGIGSKGAEAVKVATEALEGAKVAGEGAAVAGEGAATAASVSTDVDGLAKTIIEAGKKKGPGVLTGAREGATIGLVASALQNFGNTRSSESTDTATGLANRGRAIISPNTVGGTLIGAAFGGALGALSNAMTGETANDLVRKLAVGDLKDLSPVQQELMDRVKGLGPEDMQGLIDRLKASGHNDAASVLSEYGGGMQFRTLGDALAKTPDLPVNQMGKVANERNAQAAGRFGKFLDQYAEGKTTNAAADDISDLAKTTLNDLKIKNAKNNKALLQRASNGIVDDMEPEVAHTRAAQGVQSEIDQKIHTRRGESTPDYNTARSQTEGVYDAGPVDQVLEDYPGVMDRVKEIAGSKAFKGKEPDDFDVVNHAAHQLWKESQGGGHEGLLFGEQLRALNAARYAEAPSEIAGQPGPLERADAIYRETSTALDTYRKSPAVKSLVKFADSTDVANSGKFGDNMMKIGDSQLQDVMGDMQPENIQHLKNSAWNWAKAKVENGEQLATGWENKFKILFGKDAPGITSAIQQVADSGPYGATNLNIKHLESIAKASEGADTTRSLDALKAGDAASIKDWRSSMSPERQARLASAWRASMEKDISNMGEAQVDASGRFPDFTKNAIPEKTQAVFGKKAGGEISAETEREMRIKHGNDLVNKIGSQTQSRFAEQQKMNQQALEGVADYVATAAVSPAWSNVRGARSLAKLLHGSPNMEGYARDMADTLFLNREAGIRDITAIRDRMIQNNASQRAVELYDGIVRTVQQHASEFATPTIARNYVKQKFQ